MTMFVMTWAGKPEIAVCEEHTAAEAQERLRLHVGSRSIAAYGAPTTHEIDRGVLLTFHPLHICDNLTFGEASLKLEIHGGTTVACDPSLPDSVKAWFDFQERVMELLERYPILTDLVPPVVRAAWDEGTASIIDVLLEVGEGAVPDLINRELTAVKAART